MMIQTYHPANNSISGHTQQKYCHIKAYKSYAGAIRHRLYTQLHEWALSVVVCATLPCIDMTKHPSCIVGD